jgi:cephalosporin hydroxylase
MDPPKQFQQEVREQIDSMQRDPELASLTRSWLQKSVQHRYSYHFTWMDRPIIQYPQDIVAMQEILWRVRPDLVIETGIAHGGSIVFYASILELIGNGSVLGIDIDIRAHNRAALESHPMRKRFELIEGSSIDPAVVARARSAAAGKRVLVVLDSNHTHDHVLAELRAYAPLVAVGSYCVVMDTLVEDMPAGSYPDRPWDVGNNPKTAVREFLRTDARFEVDTEIETKLQITVASQGYLRRLKEPAA